MALWLVRAGSHGEYEQRFLETKRIYVTWDGLNTDLSRLGSQADLRAVLLLNSPASGTRKLIAHACQIWPFVMEMKAGDWVILPVKSKAAIHIAEITGGYEYDSKATDPYYHSRTVKWIQTDIPRTSFPQDLLHSFGAFLTICRIKRNDAEKRVREMAMNGWKTVLPKIVGPTNEAGEIEGESFDIEDAARDAIAKTIIAKFKGHGLARLVDAVLRVQGYHTFLSPPGADKGIDILAAPEPLGFGQPRICVQVKSGDDAIDRPTLDQLIGTMQNVHADQGLLVAWGGFKSSVDREIPAQFFRVRLWNRKSLIDELLQHYDKLDSDIRAELPLKQIWTIASDDSDD